MSLLPSNNNFISLRERAEMLNQAKNKLEAEQEQVNLGGGGGQNAHTELVTE